MALSCYRSYFHANNNANAGDCVDDSGIVEKVEKVSRCSIGHQVESVLGALETELLNGQPEVNKIAALRWKEWQQSAGNDDQC